MQTARGVIYSDWETKNLLKEKILNIMERDAFTLLTPWERLQCIYYDGLPLLSLKITNHANSLITKRDLLKACSSIDPQLNSTLTESANTRKNRREKLDNQSLF